MRIALVALVAACDGASPELGLDAVLWVDGAQYRPGPFPADDGGPAALDVLTRHGQILTDRVTESLDATLEPPSRGAAIGIAGVDGAWLIAAGPPDFDTPGMPSAKARFGVREAGPFELVVAASDASGRFGAPARTQVVADDAPPPTGELVIGLVWSGAADLDIHVVDALGGEAWSDDPNTYEPPPPGTPAPPNAWKAGGILDHDGNRDCRREGHPTEYVVWTMPPPSGTYVVRVDARSMCGDAVASWYVEAHRGDEVLGAARGSSTEEDVQLDHGKGAGVRALQFALP